jgi:hypothetical protein
MLFTDISTIFAGIRRTLCFKTINKQHAIDS